MGKGPVGFGSQKSIAPGFTNPGVHQKVAENVILVKIKARTEHYVLSALVRVEWSDDRIAEYLPFRLCTIQSLRKGREQNRAYLGRSSIIIVAKNVSYIG